MKSVLPRRYHVLFFIEHGSRRAHHAGPTRNPDASRVAQQARNLGLFFAEQQIRFLLRDRDSTYTGPLDDVLPSEQITIPRTPVPPPNATAIAERSVRAECLDWLPILNRRHLERVPRVYIEHDNAEPPHRAIALRPPDPPTAPTATTTDKIRRRDKLGRRPYEYYRAAAKAPPE